MLGFMGVTGELKMQAYGRVLLLLDKSAGNAARAAHGVGAVGYDEHMKIIEQGGE